MGKYFGTDGFRGEANIDLTVEHAYKVGRFLGWHLGKEKKRPKVVIGKDTRRSSYMFEHALVAGLTASGANAYMLYVTTTPSVSYVVRTEQFDCGIMISASHNPYYDNGIKLINAKGHKMDAEVEEQIEAYIDGKIGELPFATKSDIGRAKDYASGRNRYIGYLISLATRSFKNVKVGLDCSNGSSSSIAKNVFETLGAEVYVINNEPDGTNINTNCGSTHIEILKGFVKECPRRRQCFDSTVSGGDTLLTAFPADFYNDGNIFILDLAKGPEHFFQGRIPYILGEFFYLFFCEQTRLILLRPE